MNLFIESHQQLVNALLNADVEFIIIGGYSVMYHGYTRYTGDIDIFLKPDNANKEKLLIALKSFNIDDDSIDDIRTLDFTETIFFKFGEEPDRIDFLTRISLVSYEDADKQKVVADLDGTKI